ncbi:hypothetical protein TNCV_3961001 [Trichonephila clavipes]|nr:hypothetical protein TNCV_3961001 [Trichonephila clavipes]
MSESAVRLSNESDDFDNLFTKLTDFKKIRSRCQNRIARPHTARLSQQCLQGYDVLPWPARSPDLLANRACLERAGKATAAVPRYRRINCADAKTMAGSSTGGHK